MNQRNSDIRVMAILIYTVIVGIFILTSSLMETTLFASVITLILSFSIIVIYSVSRDLMPKFMRFMIIGANIATLIVTIVEMTLFM